MKPEPVKKKKLKTLKGQADPRLHTHLYLRPPFWRKEIEDKTTEEPTSDSV